MGSPDNESSDTESCMHRQPHYDPTNPDRPTGILTAEHREALLNGNVFSGRQTLENEGYDVDAIHERVLHSLLDFHLLAIYTDDATREAIFYEGGSPDDFKPDVPSAPEAAVEDIIAFLRLGIQDEAEFYTLLESGLERAEHLNGNNATVTVSTTYDDYETAADIATRLDEEGVEAVTPRELQILYFAEVITRSEYRELFAEKFHFIDADTDA